MNENLQFRVWNTQEKCWALGFFAIMQDGELLTHDWTIKDGVASPVLTLADETHHKIERCTGLKDRNGKLIFEGDRVKDDIVGVIKSFNGGLAVEWEDESIDTIPAWALFEIIGTIHDKEAADAK